jgi:hypothetical protein
VDCEVDCLQLQVETPPQNMDLSVDYDEAFDMRHWPSGPAQRPACRKRLGLNASRSPAQAGQARNTTNASTRRLSIPHRTDFSDCILSRNKRHSFNAFCMAAGSYLGQVIVRCTISSFPQLHAGVDIGENHENADCCRDACCRNRFAGFGANPNAPCSDPAKSITVRPAHRPVRRSQRGSAAFWHPRQRSLRQQSLSRVRSRFECAPRSASRLRGS